MKSFLRTIALLVVVLLPFLATACAETADRSHLSDVGGSYYPDPGYKWVNPNSPDLSVVWTPGISYAQNGATLYPHVLSASTVGLWYPAPGYKWSHTDSAGNPIDFVVQWDPGRDYHKSGILLYSNVQAAYTENSWYPAPGYTWENVDANGQSIDFKVRWSPGTVYSYLGTIQFPHVLAGDTEGGWYPAPGYRWTRSDASGHPAPGDLYVTWSPRDAYYNFGTLKWPHLQAANTETVWYPAPGYVWAHTDSTGASLSGDLSVRWQPGITYDVLGQVENAHIFSSDKDGSWHPESGYVWAHPENKDDLTVIAAAPAAAPPPPEEITRTQAPVVQAPAPIQTTVAPPPPPDDQPRKLR